MPKAKAVTFAVRLRQLREAARLTQVELAERAGVRQSELSKLETGRRAAPGWDTVVRLARALGVSVSAFER